MVIVKKEVEEQLYSCVMAIGLSMEPMFMDVVDVFSVRMGHGVMMPCLLTFR